MPWTAGTTNFALFLLITPWPPNHMPKQSVEDPYDTALNLLWSHEQWCLEGIWSLNACLWRPFIFWCRFSIPLGSHPPCDQAFFFWAWLVDSQNLVAKTLVHQNFGCHLVYYKNLSTSHIWHVKSMLNIYVQVFGNFCLLNLCHGKFW